MTLPCQRQCRVFTKTSEFDSAVPITPLSLLEYICKFNYICVNILGNQSWAGSKCRETMPCGCVVQNKDHLRLRWICYRRLTTLTTVRRAYLLEKMPSPDIDTTIMERFRDLHLPPPPQKGPQKTFTCSFYFSYSRARIALQPSS
jgi:hypothetical protein